MPRWLIYTLLTMVLWGGWALLSKPASTAVSSWEAQAFSACGLIPVVAILLASRGVRASGGTWGGFGIAFASGALGSFGNVAYFQALSMGGKAAAVTPLTALYPVVTIFLALLFLKERLNPVQIAGALLSLAALYCFNVGGDALVLSPWLAVALLPIGLWGFSAFLQKLATGRTCSELATAAFLLGELPVALLTPLFVEVNWGLAWKTWLLLLAVGLLLGLGNLTLIFAYGQGGKASIVTPLASLYSLVTIPLAVWLLDERISSRESLGILLAVLAAAALCAESTRTAPSSEPECNQPSI